MGTLQKVTVAVVMFLLIIGVNCLEGVSCGMMFHSTATLCDALVQGEQLL